MPVTKTFWRGKVGTRDFGAYNVIEPVTSVPVTSIYCTRNRCSHIIGTYFSCPQGVPITSIYCVRYRYEYFDLCL